jgi:hypothetical protein
MSDKIMSAENLSKGVMRVGIQGSGKTFAAMTDAIDLLERGFRFCWITTQGERQCKLIDYIPAEYKKDVELFAPYKERSKGFNWLKCYENNDNERQLRAQSTVFLIKNLFDHMSSNIEYGIYIATLAVLEYGYMHKQEVTLYDTWKFIDDEPYRAFILKAIRNPDIALGMMKLKDETWQAISRKMGYLLINKNFRNAICYTYDDALDFREMFDKVFICDLIEDNIYGLGTMQAITIAKAVMIQFNLLASTRNISSNFYQIICDEFYRYADGIEDVFRDFPDLHRQRRMGLYLIWQRISQMNDDLVDIALSCTNKYFMMISPEDDSTLSTKEAYKPYKGQFSSLAPREFISFLNIMNTLTVIKGKTKDIPLPNEYNYSYVGQRCQSKLRENTFRWWYNDCALSEDNIVTLSDSIEGDIF